MMYFLSHHTGNDNKSSNSINSNFVEGDLTEEETGPTVVQFFNQRYIDFRLTSSDDQSSSEHRENMPIYPFSMLSYHAAGLEDDILGVWNFQVLFQQSNNNNKLVELLLSNVVCPQKYSRLPFLIALDFNEPTAVAPLLHASVEAILACCNNNSKDTNNCSSCSTSLEDLKSIRFGDAPTVDVEQKPTTTNNKITLILACILPTKEALSYKETQIQALLTYHLHRYAYLTKSTLIFVSPSSSKYRVMNPDEQAEGSCTTSSSVGIDILKLTNILYRMASPVIEQTDETVSADEDETKETTKELDSKWLFTPDDHDPAMIETTLRRNARCEGAWDVENDSLRAILPQPEKPERLPKQQTNYDDNIWLGKLASTVRVTENANAVSTTGSSGDAKGKSTSSAPMEKKKSLPVSATDPTSFFESLLKKN